MDYIGKLVRRWVRMIVGPLSGAIGILTQIFERLPGDVDIGPYTINVWITIALGAVSWAQYKIWRDLREDTELNLDIEVPQVVRYKSGLMQPVENDGWLVVLQGGTRFTNRSSKRKVSLGFILEVSLVNSLTGQKILRLTDDTMAQMATTRIMRNLPDLVTYLRPPIPIRPEESVSGDLAFFILPMIEAQVGGSEVIDHNDAHLTITDHVSGRTLRVRVPTWMKEPPPHLSDRRKRPRQARG